jgi:chromosomal replication initiation ATPase DnaA
MNPQIKLHYPLIYDEILKAQNIIKQKTGLDIKLLIRRNDTKVEEILSYEFKEFFKIWGVNLVTVSTKSREFPLPEYRYILWLYCRLKHPKFSLKKIGSFVGVVDHTSVIHGLNTAYKMLETQDEQFLSIYNPVKHLLHHELDETV